MLADDVAWLSVATAAAGGGGDAAAAATAGAAAATTAGAAAAGAPLQAAVGVVAATTAGSNDLDVTAADLSCSDWDEELLVAANTASKRLWTLRKSSPLRRKCSTFICLV